MTDQEFVVYKDDRYSKIMKYYDDKANRSRFWYRFYSAYILVVSVAVTPILNLLPDSLIKIGSFTFGGKVIVSILSPTVALAAGLLSLFRCYGNWLSYRATWDALGHELHWYNADCGEYRNAPDKKCLFVDRVEALIISEGTGWFSRHKGGDIASSCGKQDTTDK
ncbi:MAG TPA: hypothetical protein DCY56_06750 [Candidatus Omnitrophica bacterium]|nr:hypothetical protein [Candidatus Omnitrophota bacterium]